MNNELTVGSLQLPPYGIMDNDYLKNLGSKNLVGSPAEPVVPPDFEPKSCDPIQRERQWIELRGEILADIADALWPVWNSEQRVWSGAAAKMMLDLTRTDLDLLLKIRVCPGQPLNEIPTSKLRALNCPAHSSFFAEEDTGKIFASYAYYDRSLDATLPASFGDAFFAGLAAKCSSTQLQFKARFQRPRAYQIAYLMGETDFNLEEAVSSMTPSMVSGHSLQGLIGVGAVFERIFQSGITFSEDSGEALRQYAVDIGDRRVMAGVHYPSDNLGSWIVLMRLASYIYRSPEVKSTLWRAITEQSLVYKLIVDSGEKAYLPSLDLFARLNPSK